GTVPAARDPASHARAGDGARPRCPRAARGDRRDGARQHALSRERPRRPVLSGALLALAAALAALAVISVRRAASTRRRLEAAARELESLQRAFARLAPPGGGGGGTAP